MPTDLLLDDNMDFRIENGDLVVGESSLQQQHLLLVTGKNDWKQYPSTGVDIESYLDDENPADMHREIRQQFAKDGMKVKTVRTELGKLIIEADYEKD